MGNYREKWAGMFALDDCETLRKSRVGALVLAQLAICRCVACGAQDSLMLQLVDQIEEERGAAMRMTVTSRHWETVRNETNLCLSSGKGVDVGAIMSW